MEIIAGPLDWTQFDAEKLAAFLDTDTGKRFIPKLVENAPVLLDDGSRNKILIRAGEVRGFQIVVREIIQLAHPVHDTSAPPTEYPSLDNDEAWQDGQKLTPDKQ